LKFDVSPVEGIGLTKMQAKHDAAYKMMFQIRETYRAGGTLNTVPRVKLVNCCEWFVHFGTILLSTGLFYRLLS
jgi:RISC-loading complex subunit TARBP2